MRAAYTIEYSSWEGDAAVLFKYPDGRRYGFAHMGGRWHGDLASEIVAKAKVRTEAEFHRAWPDLALPDAPK